MDSPSAASDIESRCPCVGLEGRSIPAVLRHAAMAVTTCTTALIAALDFTLRGEINASIFYVVSVAAAGWSRSRAFLWATTAATSCLAIAGLAFGPQPSRAILAAMYVNRVFVAIGLLVTAMILHQRMNALERLDSARVAQALQNELLRDREAELHRVNDELEHRVEREVARRLEIEASLHQAQKMEAIGQLTGGLAHDFGNILMTVTGSLERLLGQTASDDPRRRSAETALHGAEQGAQLVRRLLSFARRQRLEPQPTAIDQTVGAALTLARQAVGERIKLVQNLEPDLWTCFIDPDQLESAVLNLIINARDATPGDGRVAVVARNVTVERQAPDLAAGDYVLVTVEDTGGGMTPEVQARALEPFFTTKPVGKGSGLGLSMVHGFTKQSGGALRLESAPGQGTSVRLYLPRAAPRPARIERDEAGATPARR